MEASQPLPIESFSYSWLVNLNPSFQSPDCSFRVSIDACNETFIEMDPNLTPSKRFLVAYDQDFDFKLPPFQPPMTPVHADELISNGIMVSLSFDLFSTTHISSPGQLEARFDNEIRASPLTRRYLGLPKRIMHKYLDLVRPFWLRMQAAKNWRSSASSWRRSQAESGGVWRRSCDSESSIHEAVLHCKKTNGPTSMIS